MLHLGIVRKCNRLSKRRLFLPASVMITVPPTLPGESVSTFAYTAHDLASTVPGATLQTVLSAPGGLVIESIAVDHGPVPAVAFRIEYKGHIVVYSGDMGAKGIGAAHLRQGNMASISQGADLLTHDTAVMEAGDAPPTRCSYPAQRAVLDCRCCDRCQCEDISPVTSDPVTSPRVDEIQDIIKGAGLWFARNDRGSSGRTLRPFGWRKVIAIALLDVISVPVIVAEIA